MRISYREAFLGKKQLQRYQPIFGCELLEDKKEYWDAVVKAHPDIWEVNSHILKKIYRMRFPWFQMTDYGKMDEPGIFINYMGSLGDLGRESNPYIHHAATNTIIFNNIELGRGELEDILPEIDSALRDGITFQRNDYIKLKDATK